MTGARDPRRIEFDRALGAQGPQVREQYKQYFLSLPEEVRDAEHERVYGISFYPRPMERTDVKPLEGWSAAGEAWGRAAESVPTVSLIARASQGKAPWTPDEQMPTFGGKAELPMWAKGLQTAATIAGSIAELKGLGMLGKAAGLSRHAAGTAAFTLSGVLGARGDSPGEWATQAAIGGGTGLATGLALPWAGGARKAARDAGKPITALTGLGSSLWRTPAAMAGTGLVGETAQRWAGGQDLTDAAVASLESVPRSAAMGAVWGAIGHVGQVRGERAHVAKLIKERYAEGGGKVVPLAEGMVPLQFQGGTPEQQGRIRHAYEQIAKKYPKLRSHAQVNVVEGLKEQGRWAQTTPTLAKGGKGLGITIDVDARLGSEPPATILDKLGDEMRHFRKLMLGESHLGRGQQREAAREGKLWRGRSVTAEEWAKEKKAINQAVLERMKAQGIEPGDYRGPYAKPEARTHPEHLEGIARYKARVAAAEQAGVEKQRADWLAEAAQERAQKGAAWEKRKAVTEVQGQQARAAEGREANLRRAAEGRAEAGQEGARLGAIGEKAKPPAGPLQQAAEAALPARRPGPGAAAKTLSERATAVATYWRDRTPDVEQPGRTLEARQAARFDRLAEQAAAVEAAGEPVDPKLHNQIASTFERLKRSGQFRPEELASIAQARAARPGAPPSPPGPETFPRAAARRPGPPPPPPPPPPTGGVPPGQPPPSPVPPAGGPAEGPAEAPTGTPEARARKVIKEAIGKATGELPFGQKRPAAPAAPAKPAREAKPVGPTEPYVADRVRELREHWAEKVKPGTYDKVKEPANRAALERGAKAKAAQWAEVEKRAAAGQLTDVDVARISSAHKEMRRRVRAAAPPAPRVAPTAPVEGAMPQERVVRGKPQTMRTSAGTYQGDYALVPADSVTLSHNPEGMKRFVENPRFKSRQDQPRDYTDAKEAKQVADLREKFERDPSAMSIILNTNPSADTGVPIVTESGVVLNGTKRTLAKRTLDIQGKGAVYDKALDAAAGDFGFTPEQVAAARKKFGSVELVRIVKGVKEGTPQSAAFAAEGNVSTITAQNIYRSAQTYSALIPDKILQHANVPENATVKDALHTGEFRTAFRQAIGKVAPQRLTEFFDGENLTTSGKELATTVALVKVLPPQTVEAVPVSWRNAMVEALPQLIRGVKLKGPANLVPWIKEAMSLRAEIEASGQPFNSKTINDYLNQPAMFGEKATRTLSPEAKMVLDSLDKLATSPAKFRAAVKQFTAGPSLLDKPGATDASRFAEAFGVVERAGSTFGEGKGAAPRGKPLAVGAGAPVARAVLEKLRKAKEKAEPVVDALRAKLFPERVGTKISKSGASLRQMFVSPDVELGKTKGGQRVRAAMRNYEQEGASIAEKFSHEAEAIRINHGLSRGEFDHIGAFLDPKFRSRAPAGVLVNPEARAAAGEMKGLLNRHFKQAADLGVMVRVELPKGKAKWAPLADMKIEDYWRRAWDPQFTREIMRGRGPIYEANVKHLVTSGQARTEKIARTMLAISGMEQTGQAPSWADVSKMISEAPGVTGVTRRIHWGGFEQRRMDLLPSAYAYTWSKVAQDMAFGYGKMIAGTKQFGQKLEHLIPALKHVAAEQGADTARAAYTAIVRQMGMEGSTPAGRTVGKLARASAWAIMSSPKTAMGKNLAIGLHRTYAALGGRSLVAGVLQSSKHLLKNIGLRMQGKAPEMSLAQRAGAIQAGAHVIESAFGKFGSKLSPWYRVTESALRGTAAEAGMHRLGQSLAALGTARPGSKGLSRALHFLENIANLTPKEIGILKGLHDSAATNRAGFRAVGESKAVFRKLFEKVGYWSAANTQGVTTARTLPLPASTEVGRAGSVFYRMAYAGLVNDVRNVIKPLVKDFDVLPAVRYVVGGVVAGEGLYALYHALLRREHPSADASVARRMMDDLMAVEGASFASKVMESGGRGWKDAAGIVVVDSLMGLTEDVFDLAGRKLTARQATHDIGMRSVGLYRDIVQAAEANAGGDHLRHRLIRAQFRNIGVREGVFPRSGMEIERTKKTPHLRALQASFWSDEPKDWKASYKATVLYMLDREGLTFSEARTAVAQAIADESPYPSTMKLKARQKVIEQLDDKGRARLEAAEKSYQERRQRFLKETGMAAEHQRRKGINRRVQRVEQPRLRERLRQRLEELETARGKRAVGSM